MDEYFGRANHMGTRHLFIYQSPNLIGFLRSSLPLLPSYPQLRMTLFASYLHMVFEPALFGPHVESLYLIHLCDDYITRTYGFQHDAEVGQSREGLYRVKNDGNGRFYFEYEKNAEGTPNEAYRVARFKQPNQADSKKVELVMRSLVNLKTFTWDHSLVPSGIVGLIEAPLTSLSLHFVLFGENALDSLIEIISRSSCLRELEIYLKTEEDGLKQSVTSLFVAISKSTSIRDFKFGYTDRYMDDTEVDALITLIEESECLRSVTIFESIQGLGQICDLLDALAVNTSLENFHMLNRLKDISPPLRSFRSLPAVMNDSFFDSVLDLLESNYTLKVCKLRPMKLDPKHSDLFIGLEEAFYENPILESFQIADKCHFEKRETPTRIYIDIEPERKKNSLDHDAAILLRAGRLLSVANQICGQEIPTEIIESIICQITEDSDWEKENWKIIRRGVMDRMTIGKLVPDSEQVPYDAYELMYRCKSLNVC